MLQWPFTRHTHDESNIHLMVGRFEPIATSATPMRQAQIVKVLGARKKVDPATMDRAAQLTGIEGLRHEPASGHRPRRIGALPGLWKVEQAFRVTQSDLWIRATFHRQRDATEPPITVGREVSNGQ